MGWEKGVAPDKGLRGAPVGIPLPPSARALLHEWAEAADGRNQTAGRNQAPLEDLASRDLSLRVGFDDLQAVVPCIFSGPDL